MQLLVLSGLGALVAGCYGAVHDQVTFSVAPEYFTCLKFKQFRAFDFGFPPSVFASEIGFLASWPIGLIAFWLLTRFALPIKKDRELYVVLGQGAIIMLVIAMIGATIGFVWGSLCQISTEMSDMLVYIGVTEERRFIQVGYLHNGSYIGAIFALLIAVLWVRRARV
jgi:hypothetical protein